MNTGDARCASLDKIIRNNFKILNIDVNFYCARRTSTIEDLGSIEVLINLTRDYRFYIVYTRDGIIKLRIRSYKSQREEVHSFNDEEAACWFLVVKLIDLRNNIEGFLV
jgi:hypothetical protein